MVAAAATGAAGESEAPLGTERTEAIKQEQAAASVQAVVRGRAVRTATSKTDAELWAEREAAREAREAALWAERTEAIKQEQAAASVQAVVRGRAVRTATSKTDVELWAEREAAAKQAQAAASVQAVVRGRAVRQSLTSVQESDEAAAEQEEEEEGPSAAELAWQQRVTAEKEASAKAAGVEAAAVEAAEAKLENVNGLAGGAPASFGAPLHQLIDDVLLFLSCNKHRKAPNA